ncbi:MAG: DUF4440 domain-containing protein [Candidatus Kariarchaeaceae archaeon]|jgi:hypothetical protein
MSLESFLSGESVQQEIIDLHQFFEDWFTGEVKEDITRFDSVMAPDFELISPSGQQINRQSIVDMIAQGYNSQTDRKIWVEDITCRVQGDLVIATYYELQSYEGEHTKRISTAIFSYDPELPCSSLWHHVHETWT